MWYVVGGVCRQGGGGGGRRVRTAVDVNKIAGAGADQSKCACVISEAVKRIGDAFGRSCCR
jgi:hypothetical protein